MGVPGADDIMLNYQSTSFHDALYCARCWACGPRRSSRRGWSGRVLIDATRPHPAARAAEPLPRAAAGLSRCPTTPPTDARRRRVDGPVLAPADPGAHRARPDRRVARHRAAARFPAWPTRRRATPCTSRSTRRGWSPTWRSSDVPVLSVASAGADRQNYLLRPDLGRRLAAGRRGHAGAVRTPRATTWRSSSPTACRRAPCRPTRRRCLAQRAAGAARRRAGGSRRSSSRARPRRDRRRDRRALARRLRGRADRRAARA